MAALLSQVALRSQTKTYCEEPISSWSRFSTRNKLHQRRLLVEGLDVEHSLPTANENSGREKYSDQKNGRAEDE